MQPPPLPVLLTLCFLETLLAFKTLFFALLSTSRRASSRSIRFFSFNVAAMYPSIRSA